jgi:hypothetical protein
MYRILMPFLLFTTLLLAQTPKPYSNLGDEIYNSTQQYKKVAPVLSSSKGSVEKYLQKVRDVKALGFEAEFDKSVSKEYLKALRALDKDRQMLLTSINASLYQAMDNVDKSSFKKIINSNLLKMDKIGDDVIPFYKKHFKKGSIKKIDEILALEARYKREQKKANANYAKRVEERRIERMRAASQAADDAKEAEMDAQIERERQKVNETLETEIIR